jgi:hypothetical protein
MLPGKSKPLFLHPLVEEGLLGLPSGGELEVL